MSKHYVKDPQAVLDYGIDWSKWLVGGDTISSASWSVTGTDDDLVVDDDYLDSSVAGVWLSAGSVGSRYQVTCHVVTAAGREDDRSLFVRCEQR